MMVIEEFNPKLKWTVGVSRSFKFSGRPLGQDEVTDTSRDKGPE
jgi:hypothetical protein